MKFLLIFFIIIYLVGYLGRWFFRNWLKKMSGQQGGYSQPNQKKEGEVTINVDPAKNKNKNQGDGEYIDYEEVK